MKKHLQKSTWAALLGLLLIFSSCQKDYGDDMTAENELRGIPLISDGANLGNGNFYFLPPMVPSPTTSGIFDADQSPEVRIIVLDNGVPTETPLATFDLNSGLVVSLEEEHYRVNWSLRDYELDPQVTYRIEIQVSNLVLGFADVDIVANGSELKNVDTNEYIPLTDNRTLSIKFRIEEGALANSINELHRLAWYPFNGNADDESGYGNHGTVFGAALATDRFGFSNSAYSFDGMDDFIQVPSASQNLFTSSDWTVSVWFLSTTTEEAVIWNKRNTSSCGSASGPTTGFAQTNLANGNTFTGFARSSGEYRLYSQGSVSDGLWNNGVMVREGNTLSLYLNGNLEQTMTIAAGADFTTTLDLFIGKTIYCSGEHFEGKIDDFAIYDVALTPDLINQIL
ncbi:LamG domain-containing protein [Robiginitalea sp. SC105]|uniref:LamG domain-containing protein n=1 Tax=Robiginitalea sp. SC105 TaxID=2762332 RepID=UPI00163A3D7E|nr:LamG domain-containing protein [Robiginitalea sp. SC105]MBC2840113.1 LamG domain-containing protein [Robiginitalea sp. SC105]